ncbi:MAG: hypothetical protein DRJ64_06985 [Thermoprotei archaeon]|nr:MAG: hypothetical protein DRJ64_06985 [Thermoprotei archaeon]
MSVITLREALKDFLKEQGLTIDDILNSMDEKPEGIIRSLVKRVNITYEEALALERLYTSRQLNLLIFAIHLFYYVNPSGLYKGRVIIPFRNQIVGYDGRITKNGLFLIMRSLGIVPKKF